MLMYKRPPFLTNVQCKTKYHKTFLRRLCPPTNPWNLLQGLGLRTGKTHKFIFVLGLEITYSSLYDNYNII